MSNDIRMKEMMYYLRNNVKSHTTNVAEDRSLYNKINSHKAYRDARGFQNGREHPFVAQGVDHRLETVAGQPGQQLDEMPLGSAPIEGANDEEKFVGHESRRLATAFSV